MHTSDRRDWFRIALPALLLLVIVALGAARVAAQNDPDTSSTIDAAQVGTFAYRPLVDASGAPLATGAEIPGQWIVVFHDSSLRASSGDATSATELAANMVSTAGGEMLFVYDAVLEGFSARLSDEGIAAIASDPRVEFVEADRVVKIVPIIAGASGAETEADLSGMEPDATQRPATWGLDRIDQRDLPLNDTYTYNFTGQGVNAYVIDTGIRPSHNEFTGRVGVLRDFVGDGRNGVDCGDGHGSHVAGTVGGTTWGVAKKVTLNALRVLDCEGSGTTAGVIAAMDWVRTNGVKPAVVNMSLGGQGITTAQSTAVRNLVNAGFTTVVAAGNDGANACGYSPAGVPEAFTVGNSTKFDQEADSSNYGTCLDIWAPGTDITSVSISSNSASVAYSGTSMASPHVAGAAALYLQANPTASAAQVMSALSNGASLNKIQLIGFGSPNRLLYTLSISTPPTPTPRPGKQLITVYVQPAGTPPRPTPIVTPTRTPTRTPTATATTVGSCTNLVKHPGFESGASAWSQSSFYDAELVCTSTSCGDTINPHSGSYMAWLGGLPEEESYIWQSIAIPAGQPAQLAYWYYVGTEETSCGYDEGGSLARIGSITTLLAGHDLCESNATENWRRQVVNMNTYAGKTIDLQFAAILDNSYNSNLFIDDVSLISGAGCMAAAEIEEATEPNDSPWPLSVSAPELKGPASGTPTFEKQR